MYVERELISNATKPRLAETPVGLLSTDLSYQ